MSPIADTPFRPNHGCPPSRVHSTSPWNLEGKMIRLVLTVFLSATVTAVSAPITTALAFTILEGEGWDGPGLGRAHLTFHFGTPTPDLTLDAQRAAFTAALDVWASVAAVSFTETARAGLPNSIDVNFMVGLFPGVLASAAGPPPLVEPNAGDVFFNDDYSWEIGNDRGSAAFDLMHVAVHELGHSLGLDHTFEPGAVMLQFTGPHKVFKGLHPDDVAGIRSLYAAVPEPSTMLLLMSGLAGLGAVAWRRDRNGKARGWRLLLASGLAGLAGTVRRARRRR
jgi:Matrixin/PEP-CTERM motif